MKMPDLRGYCYVENTDGLVGLLILEVATCSDTPGSVVQIAPVPALVTHGTDIWIRGVSLSGPRRVAISATVYEFDMKYVIELRQR